MIENENENENEDENENENENEDEPAITPPPSPLFHLPPLPSEPMKAHGGGHPRGALRFLYLHGASTLCSRSQMQGRP